MVLDSHRKKKARRPEDLTELSGWKTKGSSISRRTELARRNIQMDEIREIGRGLVVQ